MHPLGDVASTTDDASEARPVSARAWTPFAWTVWIATLVGFAILGAIVGTTGAATGGKDPGTASTPHGGGPTAGGSGESPGPAHTTLNVREYQTDGRSDADAISAAMIAARPGDTVFLPGGRYVLDRPINFASGISVVGDPADPPVLVGSGRESLQIRQDGGHPLRNTTIRGLHFDNVELALVGDAEHATIVNVTLADCVFSNGRRHDPWTSDYLVLTRTSGVTVDGCTFLRDRNAGGRGVVLSRTRGTVITDSFFGTTRNLEAGAPHGYFKTAINVLGFAGTADRNEDVVIERNVLRRTARPACPRGTDCEDHGIYVWGANNVYIGDNDVDGWTNTKSGGALKLRNSENVTVKANRFLGSGILAYTYWHRSPRHLNGVRIVGNRIDMKGASGDAGPGIFYRRADSRGSSTGGLCAGTGGERDIAIAGNEFVNGGGIDVRCADGRQICVAGNRGAHVSLAVPGVATTACANHSANPFPGLQRGDFNGDGRTDFARVVPARHGPASWQVHLSVRDGFATRQWGRLGAYSPDAERYGLLVGDFDGDRRDDVAYRGTCAASSAGCWLVQKSTRAGFSTPRERGDGVARTDETFRFGFHTGDFNGDGRDEVAFRGACGNDRHRCWAVLTNIAGAHSTVSDWGDGAYWDRAETDTYGILVGDFDGDGRDDIAYRGLCGPTISCLRIEQSRGAAFEARNGGQRLYVDPRMTAQFGMTVADENGDGRDDIGYVGRCGSSSTPLWRIHLGMPKGSFKVTCSASRTP